MNAQTVRLLVFQRLETSVQIGFQILDGFDTD